MSFNIPQFLRPYVQQPVNDQENIRQLQRPKGQQLRLAGYDTPEKIQEYVNSMSGGITELDLRGIKEIENKHIRGYLQSGSSIKSIVIENGLVDDQIVEIILEHGKALESITFRKCPKISYETRERLHRDMKLPNDDEGHERFFRVFFYNCPRISKKMLD